MNFGNDFNFKIVEYFPTFKFSIVDEFVSYFVD